MTYKDNHLFKTQFFFTSVLDDITAADFIPRFVDKIRLTEKTKEVNWTTLTNGLR